MNEEKIAMLKERAKQLRKTAVTMIYEAQSGHPGRFPLRRGHGRRAVLLRDAHRPPEPELGGPRPLCALEGPRPAPSCTRRWASWAISRSPVLHTLRQEGSMLQGHPSMVKCPGIDISTGSLGQGAACAVGMALAGKRDGQGLPRVHHGRRR